jgi:acetyl-CoA C-acetyltransferase
MRQVVIISAKRTPQGRFLGSLSKLSAVDLAVAAGKSALSDCNRPELINEIDETIIGNVLSAGQGMNIARQIAIGLGLPNHSSAFTVNMMCASGMKAIMSGCDAIRSGSANLVLCGGSESMSQAPYLLPRARTGLKFGDGILIDSILRDGLVDAFDQQHMGLNVERLAREFKITRNEQDTFACLSQSRYSEANKRRIFENEMTPVAGVKIDEHPRADTTLESLAQLKPAFDPAGSVTAGNASGINDGAAIVLLASREYADHHNIRPLAIVEDYAVAGCEPNRMGLGPVFAINKLLRDNKSLKEFDRIEINEAFAAQVLACLSELNLQASDINYHGGSIALGHPIGASGARLVVHLAHQIASGNARQTLASLCVGGGMGAALTLKKPN